MASVASQASEQGSEDGSSSSSSSSSSPPLASAAIKKEHTDASNEGENGKPTTTTTDDVEETGPASDTAAGATSPPPIPTDAREDVKAAARAYALSTATRKPKNKQQLFKYNQVPTIPATYQRYVPYNNPPPSGSSAPPPPPPQHPGAALYRPNAAAGANQQQAYPGSSKARPGTTTVKYRPPLITPVNVVGGGGVGRGGRGGASTSTTLPTTAGALRRVVAPLHHQPPQQPPPPPPHYQQQHPSSHAPPMYSSLSHPPPPSWHQQQYTSTIATHHPPRGNIAIPTDSKGNNRNSTTMFYPPTRSARTKNATTVGTKQQHAFTANSTTRTNNNRSMPSTLHHQTQLKAYAAPKITPTTIDAQNNTSYASKTNPSDPRFAISSFENDDEDLDDYARFVKLLGIDLEDPEGWKLKDDDDDEFQLDALDDEDDDDDDDDEDDYEDDEVEEKNDDADLEGESFTKDEETTTTDMTDNDNSRNSLNTITATDTTTTTTTAAAATVSDPAEPDTDELSDSNFYQELEEELGWLEEEDMEAAVATLLMDYPTKKQQTTDSTNHQRSPSSLLTSPLVAPVRDSPATGLKKGAPKSTSLPRSEMTGHETLSPESNADGAGTTDELLQKHPPLLPPATPFHSFPNSRVAAQARTVTPEQQEKLHQLMEKHYQLLIQQAVMAVRAAHSQRVRRSAVSAAAAATADSSSGTTNNPGTPSSHTSETTILSYDVTGGETPDDLVEILDGAVGMLQDLDQNRKDAIRHYIQFQSTASMNDSSNISINRLNPKRSLLSELNEDDGGNHAVHSNKGSNDGITGERRLTRAQFSKTLEQQLQYSGNGSNDKEQGKRRTVFDIHGLSKLKDTFSLIDKSVDGVRKGDSNILELPTSSKACRHVLEQAGAKVDEDLVPGSHDASMNFVDPKELLGDNFKPPCTSDQELILRRNRNLFTSGEDNLVLRGVNLYGEKQWVLIADRFLPDRSVNMISQRYSKLCFMLYKANGIKIDDKGRLATPPKLESVDDIDELAVSKLKRVDPPAILNVHRWSLAEDLTLLKAVPIMGSMWAELKARLIPHRDRGHLRKRYQVLERRVKATAARIVKTDKIITTKIATAPFQVKSSRAQNSNNKHATKPTQAPLPMPPPEKGPSTSQSEPQKSKPPTTVNQAATILARARTAGVTKTQQAPPPPPPPPPAYRHPQSYPPPLPGTPQRRPLPHQSSPPHGPPPRQGHPTHYSPGHPSPPSHHYHPSQALPHPGNPYLHHPYAPHHPNYHHPPYLYHPQYHPPPHHYPPPPRQSYPNPAQHQNHDESSRAAYEKLVHEPSREWSRMSGIDKAMERNDADVAVASTIVTQLARSPTKPPIPTTPHVNDKMNEASRDSFADIHFEDNASGLSIFDGCRPSPAKMSTAEEQATESVSFLAGVLERSNHNRRFAENSEDVKPPPLKPPEKVSRNTRTTGVASLRSPRKRKEPAAALEFATPGTSNFSNPATPLGMSPALKMSPSSKTGFSPGSILSHHHTDGSLEGVTLDTFPGGHSMDSYDAHFFSSRMSIGTSRAHFDYDDDGTPKKKTTPLKTELFGDGSTLMENDLEAISALNALSHSPAKSPYDISKTPPPAVTVNSPPPTSARAKKRKSLFDVVVGNTRESQAATAKKSNTKKRKLKF